MVAKRWWGQVVKKRENTRGHLMVTPGDVFWFSGPDIIDSTRKTKCSKFRSPMMLATCRFHRSAFRRQNHPGGVEPIRGIDRFYRTEATWPGGDQRSNERIY